MKYKVINTITGEDITSKRFWVVRPDGTLGYMEYGDFIGCPCAKAIVCNEEKA
ncbi:MAG: hypothetical protein IKL53_10190 [Lachnospiraceae bacterium]|nr:hypothetical protein [Lachnospiraceae bacterium]